MQTVECYQEEEIGKKSEATSLQTEVVVVVFPGR